MKYFSCLSLYRQGREIPPSSVKPSPPPFSLCPCPLSLPPLPLHPTLSLLPLHPTPSLPPSPYPLPPPLPPTTPLFPCPLPLPSPLPPPPSLPCPSQLGHRDHTRNSLYLSFIHSFGGKTQVLFSWLIKRSKRCYTILTFPFLFKSAKQSPPKCDLSVCLSGARSIP